MTWRWRRRLSGLKFQGPLTGLDLVSWLTVISSVVKKHMKVTE